LDNAKKAEQEVAKANLKKEEIVKEAKNNAKQIITSSEIDGKEIIKEAKEKASLEKEELIKQAKLEAEKEKKNVEEQVKKESAVLIEQGVRKIMENYVANGKGDDIIKAMLHK
jgi:F0F1-type ATP synthase membrane subunit b/b'